MTEGTEKTETAHRRDPVRRGSNRSVVLACITVLLAMGALSYAAVPLYRLFCQATGFGGTTQRAERPSNQVFDRVIRVRFDANVTPGMPWKFEPVERYVDIKVGENALVFYKAANHGETSVTGTASFNVSPEVAGQYFNKIECFCFTEQTLAAGTSIDMPVSFYIDPKIMDDRNADWLKEITLSYTFYPVNSGNAAASAKGESRRMAAGESLANATREPVLATR